MSQRTNLQFWSNQLDRTLYGLVESTGYMIQAAGAQAQETPELEELCTGLQTLRVAARELMHPDDREVTGGREA